MTKLLPAVCLLALALLATGCGEREERVSGEREKLELLLDFFPNADHAGIYAAQRGGHLEAVGLDVEIREPSDPADTIRQVAAGRVDLAISYTPEVLRARAEGQDVVSVAALVQRPLTSIISLPAARVRRPADLRGKRVGTAGIDYQSAFLRTVLERAGVDPRSVEERNVGFELSPALLNRRVDAVLGAFFNYEGVDLRRRGRNPQIIKIDEAGVPPYDELVFVANGKSLEEKEALIRSFVGAVARGTRDLGEDPDAIAALLEANPELEEALQREGVRVTLPLFAPPRGKPFGWHEAGEWRRFAKFMTERRLLKRPVPAEEAYTNDLLPGEGL